MSHLITVPLPSLIGAVNRPILIMRHALIPSHYDRTEFAKTPDAKMVLCPEGTPQSQAMGRAMGKWFADNDIRSADIWASSYKRPQETLQIASPFFGIPYDLHISKDLREADYGLWDGKSFDEIDRDFPGMRAALDQDPFYGRRPGGESKYDTLLRGDKVMRQEVLPEFFASGHEVLGIFTHSVMMRALGALLTGENEQWLLDNKPKNCEAWLIENGRKTILFPGFDIPPRKEEPLLAQWKSTALSPYAAPAIL